MGQLRLELTDDAASADELAGAPPRRRRRRRPDRASRPAPTTARSNRVVSPRSSPPCRPWRAPRTGSGSFRARSSSAASRDWRLPGPLPRATYYVIATLRVADRAGTSCGPPGLRRRRGRGDPPRFAVRCRDQAELVCFEDFPSWAEQTEAAMHTVAHQLARLCGRAGRRQRERGDGPDHRRGAAAGIFDGSLRSAVERGESYP